MTIISSTVGGSLEDLVQWNISPTLMTLRRMDAQALWVRFLVITCSDATAGGHF